MQRARFCFLFAAAVLAMPACSSMHAVAPSISGIGASSLQRTSPDLSSGNYVATYPVVEAGNYIATGSDHNLWSTSAHHIFKTTTSGTETYFKNSGGTATHIAAGAAGTLWFTDLNGNIGRITTIGTITTFAVAGASETFDIAKGPDGNMWFTERTAHSIGKITSTGSATLFAIPSGATPIGITAGPDGNLWFSATGGKNVQEFGKVTTSGSFTEFAIPGGTAGSPGAMTSGPDGKLYATNGVGGVYSVTTAGAITYYPLTSTVSTENGIAVGPDKQIWIAPGDSDDELDEFNTTTHVFSKAAKVPIAPFCGSGSTATPRGLTMGPDGDMWFLTAGCAYVGAYEENIPTIGIRLTGETSITSPAYGFELGYFNGTTSTTTQTVSLPMGDLVRFKNVDSAAPHTASFLGDATATSAPWPSSFNGSSTASPAYTAIGTTNFSTGILNPGQTSAIYDTGLPGFYMFGCAIHYNPDKMRDVYIVK